MSSLVTASSDSELRRTAWRSMHGVEPAGAPPPAGVGAELAAPLDQEVADAVEQLGRERPGADAGRVRLGDADDPVDVARPDAGAGAGAAGHRVRRGHERIGAVVEVEEGGLGAFEQDVLAGLERLVHEPDGVGDVGRQPGRELVEVPLRRSRRPTAAAGCRRA